ncbi:ABC transporter permease [Viridibacillus arvi]|nr:ABC transporter permease subunit [Viridibacillus arvi]
MIRTKGVPILLLLTVLFISGLFMRNVIQQDALQTKKIEKFTKYRSNVIGQYQTDREALKKGPNAEIEARFEVGGLLFDQLEKLIKAIEDKKWKKELKSEIEVYQSAIHFKELEGSFLLNDNDMQKAIKQNEELLKRGLPKEDLDYSIQTTVFMKKIISLLFNTAGIMIVLLVLATLITKEFEDHNMQLVYSLPIARNKLIGIKFFSLLIVGLVWLSTILLISYALPTLFGINVGEIFTYPLFTKEENFLDSGEYIIQAIIYSISFIGFSIATILFLSFFIRNSIVNSLVILIIFCGGLLVTNSGFNSIWNPFPYQNIDLAVLNTPDYYPFGAIVLIGFMILLLLLTILSNRKRGI